MSALSLDVRVDGVAVLAIDQPGRRANVLTQELWDELEAMVNALALRTDLKGLVIASAKPGVFIAGADLKLLRDAPGPNDPAVRAFMDQGNRVLFALEALPFPACAAIDGAALGGGLEVALACRFRVCGTSAKVQLGFPEVNLGLIPGWGGTQRLRRLSGEIATCLLIASGQPINADQAERISLVTKVVPTSDLLEESASLVRNVPRVPAEIPLANQAFLDLMDATSRVGLREAIAMETEAFMNLAGSPESKRRIAEFFGSRGRSKDCVKSLVATEEP